MGSGIAFFVPTSYDTDISLTNYVYMFTRTSRLENLRTLEVNLLLAFPYNLNFEIKHSRNLKEV